ncbi:sugar transferase [Mycolicibacterium moriokaense]|nr:sugar transferase [Mycolicibacterium moriokaense]
MTTLPEGKSSTVFAERSKSSSTEHPLARVTQANLRGYRWKRSHRIRVLAVDTIAVVTAVLLASVCRVGLLHDFTEIKWTTAALYSVGLAIIWLTALGIAHSRDLTLVGVGAEEYRLVLTATFWVFGIIAAVDLIGRLQIARGYLLIALPVGLIGLVVGRHLLRRHLARKRAGGAFMNQVVVLGTQDAVITLCRSFERSKDAGYKVIGACVPGFAAASGAVLKTSAGDIPVFGDEESVEAALRLSGADALAVAATERLGHERVRKLLWCLDPLGVDMIVVPGMSDIAGPRLKVRPIDNLPLVHIARPRHDSSSSRNGKRLFDLAFASIALLLGLPLFLTIALGIKLDDGGPIFFRQERNGLHGRRFRILKFRTMTSMPDSNSQLVALSDLSEQTFFGKAPSDRRVTRFGRYLRTTSLDELPQLINVLQGSMSVVGPRPLQIGEAEGIEHFTERRALVKPGMTGLWQISGRSDVSAEERVRLDHSYVDNWSCAQDIVIVLRTVKSVLKRQGAY